MSGVATYVALLRGVNVGGARPLPMAALRDALTAAGHRKVRTYVQSGNVVLESGASDELQVRGTEIYLWCPNGLGRSKVLTGVERRLGTAMTVRNWRTVTELLRLASGAG
jgi:uncharacterized protein (DUF1697 family)